MSGPVPPPSSGTLTGPITATGGVSSITAQTGTGTTFVVDTAPTLIGPVIVSAGSFGLSGAISAPAWTTAGVRYKNVAATLTDTSSSGTVAAARTDNFGGNTIAASSATTFTNYYSAYFSEPTVGTNVTFTNKYAIGADSLSLVSPTVTANAPVLNATQTWNAAGVTFTGVKVNITSTASAAGSLLADFQVGGTSKVTIAKTGSISVPQGSFPVDALGGAYYAGTRKLLEAAGNSTAIWDYASTTRPMISLQTPIARYPSDVGVGWTSTTDPVGGTVDTSFSRSSAGVLAIGTGAVGNAAGSLLVTGVTLSGVLKLGNAATTGLTPGVLAATTNATIVITDSAGQAYRIPCII